MLENEEGVSWNFSFAHFSFEFSTLFRLHPF